jgi:hypothetical protein
VERGDDAGITTFPSSGTPILNSLFYIPITLSRQRTIITGPIFSISTLVCTSCVTNSQHVEISIGASVAGEQLQVLRRWPAIPNHHTNYYLPSITSFYCHH